MGIISLFKWFRQMEKTAAGYACLSNMLFDLNQKKISKSKIKKLLHIVSDSWYHNPEIELPEDTLPKIADNKPTEFLLQGKIVNNLDCGVSRIMWEYDFIKHNLDKTKFAVKTQGYLSYLELKMLQSGAIYGSEKGSIRGSRPFAWVTSTNQINETHKEPVSNRANIIRDELGLRFFRDDQRLLQIEYFQSVLNKIEVKVPLFIEGAGTKSLIYRSDLQNDGWGQAVNLKTLKEGYREAVHEPIEFNRISREYRINNLGRLSKNQVFDFQEFIQTLKFKWQKRHRFSFY